MKTNVLGFRMSSSTVGLTTSETIRHSPGRAPTDPDPTNVEGHFQNIVKKICLIKRLCPYASVVVSPILPTKNTRLNQRVLKFNHLLFNFLANEKQGEGVRTCNLQSFVDKNLEY